MKNKQATTNIPVGTKGIILFMGVEPAKDSNKTTAAKNCITGIDKIANTKHVSEMFLYKVLLVGELGMYF